MVTVTPGLHQPMQGENIVCFAKDWSEDPTSNNHVMLNLAQRNRVLWLNSISTRTPDFKSTGDLQKIRRKIRSFARGAVQVAPGLHSYTPLVLPFPHSPLSTAANGTVLRATVSVLRRRLGMGEFQAWTFLPTAVRYIGTLGESLSVYFCTDEWSQFGMIDGARVSAMEKELCQKVDLVFATSRTLVERKRVFNPETHLASHGVDHAHFSRALDPETPLAPEVKDLRGPVLGFFGLVEEWIDVELLAFLARSRPDWNVVVIGKTKVDVSELRSLRNVVMVDRRPYSELPGYAKAFDVGLCPFRRNELTHHVNPIKLREYLSAGLPVVSTDIPECRVPHEHGRVAATPEEFLARVEEVLREDSPEKRRRRSDDMKAETWERKIEQMGGHVMRVRDRKRASTGR